MCVQLSLGGAEPKEGKGDFSWEERGEEGEKSQNTKAKYEKA